MIFFLSDNEVRSIIIKNANEANSINYILSLTNRCNLRCDYCYQSWKNEHARMSKKTIDDFIMKLLIDIKTYSYINDIFINFFGGEPLLEKDIIYYALDKFDVIAKKNNKNFYYAIDTNGVFLTNEFLKKFNNLHISITLSLPKDHNLHRGDESGYDFFSKIIHNIQNASNIFKTDDINLSLRYNVSHENISDFEKFVKFIKNLNINCSIDAQNIDNYPANTFRNQIKEIDFLKWKATDYIDILLKYHFSVSELPNVSLGRHCSAIHSASCKIWADGSIGICDFENFDDRRIINSYQKLSNSDFCNILNKKVFELPEMCLSCYDYPYCGGKKICFKCDGIYSQKEIQRLKIKSYLMRNDLLI